MVEPVKRRLAMFTLEETEKIAREMLAISRIDEMERYLEDFSRRYPST